MMTVVHEIEDNKDNKFILRILDVYVCLVGFGLPLVIRDKYFDIMVFKYYYYCFFAQLLW